MTISWVEDDFTPRVDTLVNGFDETMLHLPVAHPEWFRDGDIVRVGDDDLYDTGEVDDEYGFPIYRAHNEAVRVVSAGNMRVDRSVGAKPARAVPGGQIVTILASA